MLIKVVCAWCGGHMGIKKLNTNDGAGPSVSHGICPDCIPKATVEMEKTAFRYMKKNQSTMDRKEICLATQDEMCFLSRTGSCGS